MFLRQIVHLAFDDSPQNIMRELTHILLIEDDQITNFINRRLIQKVNQSFKVSITHNGLEGLDFLKRCMEGTMEIPQLILLDINMPVMDGFEFLEEFQKLKIDEKVVIVMLTTSDHIKDLDKLFSSGNSDIIAKPLSEKKFVALIDKYFIPGQCIKTA